MALDTTQLHGRARADEAGERLAGLRALFDRRPVAAVLAVWAGLLAFNSGAGLALKALAPQLPARVPDLLVLGADTVVIAALLAELGWWREAGFNRPAAWRNLHLLWLPAALVFVLPFVRGISVAEAGALPFLALGYALTGFTEEAWWRGLALRVLRPSGVVRAVVLSAILFGSLHLGNLVFRGSAALVLGQAVGATCFGLAYAALRVRTNTIWFLLPLHMFTDLLLHVTALPAIPLEVGRDVILLGFGLYLLRGVRGEPVVEGWELIVDRTHRGTP
jgi:membrane protease YdiL (CAAX protease family)